MAVNMFITLAACEFLLVPPVNLLPAYYVVGFFFSVYEQSRTYLPLDETEFR